MASLTFSQAKTLLAPFVTSQGSTDPVVASAINFVNERLISGGQWKGNRYLRSFDVNEAADGSYYFDTPEGVESILRVMALDTENQYGDICDVMSDWYPWNDGGLGFMSSTYVGDTQVIRQGPVNALPKVQQLNGYRPIYIRTTGNDTTGNGTLGFPYATAQKAYDEAYQANDNVVLDFGIGSFSGIKLYADWPSRIAVRGAGKDATNLGGIDGGKGGQLYPSITVSGLSAAANGKYVAVLINGSHVWRKDATHEIAFEAFNTGLWGITGSGGEEALEVVTNDIMPWSNAWTNAILIPEITLGYNISVISDQSISLGNVLAIGADNNDNFDGVTGKNITLTNCVAGSLFTMGGNGPDEEGAGAGNITLNNCIVNALDASGGVGGSLATGGAGGAITITDSTASTITGNSGGGDNAASTITLRRSEATSITAKGGDGDGGQSGNGGTVLLISSKCSNISVPAGINGDPFGSVGTITVSQDTTPATKDNLDAQRYRIVGTVPENRVVYCIVRRGYVPIESDTDYLIPSNRNAYRYGVQAYNYENVNELERANVYWELAYKCLNDETTAFEDGELAEVDIQTKAFAPSLIKNLI